MQVNSVGTVNNTSFGHRNKRKNGGIGKAVASTFIPGSGQMLNGRMGVGAAFFGIETALVAGIILMPKIIGNDVLKIKKMVSKIKPKKAQQKQYRDLIKNMSKNKFIALSVLSLAWPVMHIVNMVDAYKGKRVPVITEKKHHKCLNCN